MIMPPIFGKLKRNSFFIYAACDDVYFDAFGKSLINSVIQNTITPLHLHIFNPRKDQLLLLEKYDQVSFSYEYILSDAFDTTSERWEIPPPRHITSKIGSDRVAVARSRVDTSKISFFYEGLTEKIEKFRKPSNLEYRRYLATIKAIKRSDDNTITDRMRKTYYACARFIRLNQILTYPATFLAIDIDAIVRKEIPLLSLNHDFYIHRINGNHERFLAGGLYCNNTKSSKDFLNDYSSLLLNNLSDDYLYWGLDQDLLHDLVPKYNWGELPLSYIDWFMDRDSQIWTAKGQRKNLKVFIEEQKKYYF